MQSPAQQHKGAAGQLSAAQVHNKAPFPHDEVSAGHGAINAAMVWQNCHRAGLYSCMPLREVARLLTPGDGVEVVNLKHGVVVGQLEPAEAAGRPALLGGTGWSTLHNTHKRHHDDNACHMGNQVIVCAIRHRAWRQVRVVAMSLSPSTEHPGAVGLIRASVALLPSPWSELLEESQL